GFSLFVSAHQTGDYPLPYIGMAPLPAVGEGMSIAEAAVFANAAGALATTIAGAQPSLPQRETVDDFLAQRGGIGKASVEGL
ncbi:unnamed protein product, partial [marine sediment metagenome]